MSRGECKEIARCADDPDVLTKEKDIPVRHYTVFDNYYRPCPPTTNILPPGYYHCEKDNAGVYFIKFPIDTSDLIRFPGSMPDEIISEFESFWTKRELYAMRGEPHKRGFLLWGPPGGGKTCTATLIMKDFIDAGNIVLRYNWLVPEAINKLRNIEPSRRIMVTIEDIDTYTKQRSSEEEQVLLQFLDGDRQYSNIVVIATTNFPEDLGDRIINRPSRFDRVAYIGMPSEIDRKLYLEKKCKSTATSEQVKWVADTDNWTLAHLKELILAVEIYGLPYEKTIRRLNSMRQKKASSSEYLDPLRGSSRTGFGR
jgi:hypothetical protein